jgi:hypothetical protein
MCKTAVIIIIGTIQIGAGTTLAQSLDGMNPIAAAE